MKKSPPQKCQNLPKSKRVLVRVYEERPDTLLSEYVDRIKNTLVR